MGIGAAHAQRVDACASGLRAPQPRSQLGIDRERTVRKINFGIGRLVMQASRQLLVQQGQHGLDQAGGPGSAVEMADIGLDRADSAVADLLGLAAIGFGQGSQFDRIAQFGGGAMRLDIADALGGDARAL